MNPTRNWKTPLHAGALALFLLAAMSGLAVAQTDDLGQERAAWLLERGGLESLALTGQKAAQDEIGGGAASTVYDEEKSYGSGSGPSAGLTILASAILPGAGEALMGYKRGYIMMALDIASWTQVAKYHGDGKDYTDDYYAYADEHYSDELLVEAYNGASTDPERSGEGALYIPGVTENITSVDDLHFLPLYVTVEDDRREYYENLGKWDQFIFGWDDYLRPTFWGPQNGYEPTETISDLRQPWVSEHREVYRTMRDEANDAYKKRDQFLYFNMGLRVFSVFQVAYLNGLLGGRDDEIKVAGHTVELITETRGLDRGTIGARVSF
jgi:hypothetical protein